MKAKVYDHIKTLVDVPTGAVSHRIIPAGTEGTIVESYEQPLEGYAVDVAIPDETQFTGYSYDNVILYPDQFVVVNEEKEGNAGEKRRDRMRKAFLIHSIPRFKGWETCFRFAMDTCDTFRIIFQVADDAFDAKAGLNAGKREFLQMPSITISPYEGMENSIEMAGELNKAARELFLSFMEPSFHGETSRLWSFQFLQGNESMLRVEDFTVALLFLKQGEVKDLLALGVGVDGKDLQEIDNVWG